MKILDEGSYNSKGIGVGTAWMLHQNGTKVAVKVHPLGAADEDALDDASWLIENDIKGKELGANYIASYFLFESENDYDEAIAMLSDEASFEKWPTDVVNATRKAMFDISDNYIVDESSLKDASYNVKQHLNQNWLRVRYGGEYDSKRGNKDLFFRISSKDFDWSNRIFDFIDKFGYEITTVTVEKDVNTTGSNHRYLDKVPLNDAFFDKQKLESLSIKIMKN